MTDRRCIAMGRGPKERPHFYFGDIDRKDIDLDKVIHGQPHAMIIESHRGYHVLSPVPIVDPYVLSLADEKCPGNAVRFSPNDDLKLIRQPTHLCIRVCKIYESVFKIERLPTLGYAPCNDPLKFGIYIAAKDGIKQTGEDRHLNRIPTS